mmetsp:Transcript_63362/g.150176  ORF Transcript_63362/g.150176 Transcript_63362/m.150176 type:complete len:97 (+) Transcript_63362:258-548(+)
MQGELIARSQQRIADNTVVLREFAELEEMERKGDHKLVAVWWKENQANEEKVQQSTGWTLRCYPDTDQTLPDMPTQRKCFFSGESTDTVALFARAF